MDPNVENTLQSSSHASEFNANPKITSDNAHDVSQPMSDALPAPGPADPTTVKGRVIRPRSSTSNNTPLRGSRNVPPRDLEKIKEKLGHESIKARREELIKEKEESLRVLVDEHDTHVREKFHLERYTSLLEGWDPVHVKQEQSPVFLDYKRDKHNLLDLIPPTIGSGAVAGPSRPRNSLPSRTTRRQAHEKSEVFATPNPAASAPVAASPVSMKGKGKAPAGDTVAAQNLSTKGKDKSRDLSSLRDERSDTKASASKEMPPPPLPLKKKGRRATMDVTQLEEEVVVEDPEVQSEKGKGKKRARMSLPNLPVKKLRGETADLEDSSSPVVDSPAVEDEIVLDQPAPSLPSLAHLSFPPPPIRPRERIVGPRQVWYTDPAQLPPTNQKYGGSISDLLESYILLEDTPLPADIAPLEARAAKEGFYKNRVNWLQHQGRLLRLIEEAEAEADQLEASLSKGSASRTKLPALPARQTDHQDSLLAHMVQVRNAMLNEAKSKPIVCKRIARMIMVYWEHEQNKEERERQAEEKERKRKAKDVIRALRKRWGLAVKVVRAKLLQKQKEEQDRLGKEHLQNMLWRSSGLLEGQRGIIMGEGGEEVGEGDDSEGTEDVSEAETSSDEEDEEELDNDQDEAVSERDDMDPSTSEIGIRSDGEDADNENDNQSDLGDSENDEDGDESGSEGEEDAEVNEAEASHLARLLMADQDEAAEEVMPEEPAQPDGHVASSDTGDFVNAEELDLPPEMVHDFDAMPPSGMSGPDGVQNASADTPVISTEALVQAVELLPDAAEPSEGPDGRDDQSILAPSSQDAVHQGGHAEEPAGVVDSTIQPADGATNGDMADVVPSNGDHVGEAPSLLAYRPRSRRARQSRSMSSLVKTEDPDAEDVEFKDEAGNSDQDHDMDVEMENQEQDDNDSEDAGLLADANLPIKELLKRYGYPGTQASVESQQEQQVSTPAPDIEMKEDTSTAEDVQGITTDKSLLDESLEQQPQPGLIVEGKRNRRVRSVWTPEDNPPHPAPAPKRPKIEEVESEPEPTPSMTSEETDEEEDEEEEGETAVDGEPNKIRPPFLLRGTLRPYQQAGLEWLASLYANKMNGILADEMGLGKTIQTISLLGHLACDKGVWGQHLIIVPTSVILNWEMEFKKFLPGMKVLTYYGNQKERKEKRKGWQSVNTWQVCITSYQIVLADQHIFRRKNWVYMILDEAHNIKNFRSQRWQTLLGFKASRRLLLTGTPLQNNLMELWSLLYFLMPNGVGADATAVVGFANHKEFSEWFSNPMDKAIETGDTLDEETIETVAKLHTLLRPFILRRLKSEVETQLPGKFEHVVYCKLSKRQRFLYDEFMSRASTREALTSGGYLGVVNTLMQLRKVCNHPDLFEVRPVRTSFAMEKSVLGDYGPTEVLVRKRLLQRQDELSLEAYNLIVSQESQSAWACQSRQQLDASLLLPHAVEMPSHKTPQPPKPDTRTIAGWKAYRSYVDKQASVSRWCAIRDINRLRCQSRPVYGSNFLDLVSGLPNTFLPQNVAVRSRADLIDSFIPPVAPLVRSFADRAKQVGPMLDYYAVMPPNVVARDVPQYALPGLEPVSHPSLLDPEFDTLHQATVKLQIAFPDLSLLQYDCGKLQKLDEMLRDLKANGHRVLIFTQMTRVLDILETFLSYNGHRYLRLDGSTKIEDRQIITERFNSDNRIFCFIASSRSGGVGINLTGADTVFFYDSDWNPSMDRQCMDRAHRIGQTREVHIYRFVSIHTVEENMLKKANQKRLLDRVVIQEGDFTTEFFGKMDWRDIIDDPSAGGGQATISKMDEDERVEDIEVEGTPVATEVAAVRPRAGEERDFAKALAEVEDEEDAAAARIAQGEGELDFEEFEEGAPKRPTLQQANSSKGRVSFRDSVDGSATPMDVDTPMEVEKEVGEGEEGGEEEEDDEVGAVDEYMLNWVEEDWDWFVNY